MNGTTAETTSTAPASRKKNSEERAQELVAMVDAEMLLAALGVDLGVSWEEIHYAIPAAVEELADDIEVMVEHLERTGSNRVSELRRHIARARTLSEMANHIRDPRVPQMEARIAELETQLRASTSPARAKRTRKAGAR